MNENTIMVCQELFFKSDNRDQRSQNVEFIKSILTHERIYDSEYDADNTSCIFYNQNIWNVDKLEIKRNVGKGDESKRSNAYMFTNKINTLIQFVVVNIHLIAKTPDREILSYTRLDDNINVQQNNELSNILNKTITSFRKFDIPIYLCGDFNRNDNKKDIWVQNILMKFTELDIQNQILQYHRHSKKEYFTHL